MVRTMATIFLLRLFSTNSQAQILPFLGDKTEVAAHDKVLKSLEDSDPKEAGFEEKYLELVRVIESYLDEQRGKCSEMNSEAKRRCFRELVSWQKQYLEKSYKVKRNWLELLHERQLNELGQFHKKSLEELDKQF